MSEVASKQRSCDSLCVVIPVFNEEEVIPLLWTRLLETMQKGPVSWRIVFVDDGSTDGTLAHLYRIAEEENRAGVISLSRNFGHQAAIAAGLEIADADGTVIMDADLQDPPELISDMVAAYEDGFDVVFAQRRSREGESVFKKASAATFYRIMRFLAGERFPADAGDFRLISREVVTAINNMPETHRFVRGMVAWVGFKQKAILFDRDERAAGRTKYGLTKMIRFAWSAITSFSAFPVRMGIPFGSALLVLLFLYSMRVLYVKFVLQTAVPGWTTIVLLQLGFFGLMFFYLGIIGDYLGRVYEEGKRRPLYIVRVKKNLD